MLQSVLKPDRNFLGKPTGLLVSLGFLLWKSLWSERHIWHCFLSSPNCNSTVLRRHYLAERHCCVQNYCSPCLCWADPLERYIGTAWKHQVSWPHGGPPTCNTLCCSSGNAPLPFPWVSKQWSNNWGQSQSRCPPCSPPHRSSEWTVGDWLEERRRCWEAAETMTIPSSWAHPLSTAAHPLRGCLSQGGHRRVPLQPLWAQHTMGGVFLFRLRTRAELKPSRGASL